MTKRKTPPKSVPSKTKASGSYDWIKFKKTAFRWIKFLIVGFLALSVLSAILFRFVPIPVTPLMLIRSLEQITNSEKDFKLQKDWVSLEEISKFGQLAVVCAEDQKYLDHFGFDLESIKKVIDNKSNEKRIRGASTISQQTAKNVFLWPGRSWIRKGFEVYFTLLIETFWSKKRILEVYLNIAEMGEGV